MEDNPADARWVSLALLGLNVPSRLTTVKDGKEALNFLNQRDFFHEAQLPDIILLDWYIPTLDGEDFLKEIRCDPHLKNIPVVVVSGSGWNDDVFKAYSAGANFYMTKPLGLDKFAIILNFMEEVLRIKFFPS